MSAGLNYSKAKHQARANHAIHTAGPDTASTATGWTSVSLRGWRTEWDGDPFTVTVTKIDNVTLETSTADTVPATCAR